MHHIKLLGLSNTSHSSYYPSRATSRTTLRAQDYSYRRFLVNSYNKNKNNNNTNTSERDDASTLVQPSAISTNAIYKVVPTQGKQFIRLPSFNEVRE